MQPVLRLARISFPSDDADASVVPLRSSTCVRGSQPPDRNLPQPPTANMMVARVRHDLPEEMIDIDYDRI